MNIWENFNFDNPKKTTITEMTKQDKMSINDYIEAKVREIKLDNLGI
jgi:hypothetical protein